MMRFNKDDLVEMLRYPRSHGSPMEKEFIAVYIDSVPGMNVDGFGNRYIKVGKSDTAFLSHIDTVHTYAESTQRQDVLVSDGFAFKDIHACELKDESGVCLLPYDEHIRGRVAVLKVKHGVESNDDEELSAFVSACDKMLLKEKLDGIDFVDW